MPERCHLQAALGAARLGQEGDAVLGREVLHQLPQREVGLLRLRPAAACSWWHWSLKTWRDLCRGKCEEVPGRSHYGV